MVVKKKPTEQFQFDEEVYSDLTFLKSENAQIKTEISNLSQWVQKISSDISSMKDSSRFPVALVLTTIGLLMAVMTTIGSMALNPIRDSVNQHKNLDGHVDALVLAARHDERIKSLKEFQVNMDVVLQREMRDLDVILQREIGLEASVLKERIDALNEKMAISTSDRVRREEYEHTIKAIEERIKIFEEEQRRRTNRVYGQ